MSGFKLLHKYDDIIQLIDSLDLEAYARTRNYTNGAVSHLSPYISRGVISLPFVMQRVLQRYTAKQAHAFIFELAWREYFQRQFNTLQQGIWNDIKQPQQNVVQHSGIPTAILHAKTEIAAIDEGIVDLYGSMYMHNHLRMYVASLVCNIAKVHWLEPSKWMYYHLADHDLASNTLSWQWVAGTFASKKYYCNQENINKYTASTQTGTFMDKPYEDLPHAAVPNNLAAISPVQLSTTLPATPLPVLDERKPLLVYNAYNLDPNWRKDMDANRVLLLEPSHYNRYPVSTKVLDFIMQLSNSIDGIQLYVGEFEELVQHRNSANVYAKQHPAFNYYTCIKDEPALMFANVETPKGSFMNYWKKCERYLH